MDPPLRRIKLERRYGHFGKSGDLAVMKVKWSIRKKVELNG